MHAAPRPDDARPAAEVRAWLAGRPPLDALRDAFPAEWEAVRSELAGIDPRGEIAVLQARIAALAAAPAPAREARRRHGARAALAAEARRQMTVAQLKALCVSAATGKTDGRLRFGLVCGWVAQQLLFARGLERKPVSMAWFRLVWPLLWQRRFLMPLVGPKGIYCFYSRRLVRELARTIGDRPCLEIAAGDGTLSRFLAAEGVDVVATDDHSWGHAVDYPGTVLREGAREALRRHRPKVVLCSWPPPGNDFEAAVLADPGVELYVVIGSRHRFAAGDPTAYEAQTAFDRTDDERLARLVLPPELESAVHVFERRAASRPPGEGDGPAA
jgi:hypothetical protein